MVCDLNALLFLQQEAAPYLQKGSSVIFVSSITAYLPAQGMAMYGVTKTALVGLTKVSSNWFQSPIVT